VDIYTKIINYQTDEARSRLIEILVMLII